MKQCQPTRLKNYKKLHDKIDTHRQCYKSNAIEIMPHSSKKAMITCKQSCRVAIIPCNSQEAGKPRYLHYKVGISSMKAFRQDRKKTMPVCQKQPSRWQNVTWLGRRQIRAMEMRGMM